MSLETQLVQARRMIDDLRAEKKDLEACCHGLQMTISVLQGSLKAADVITRPIATHLHAGRIFDIGNRRWLSWCSTCSRCVEQVPRLDEPEDKNDRRLYDEVILFEGRPMDETLQVEMDL